MLGIVVGTVCMMETYPDLLSPLVGRQYQSNNHTQNYVVIKAIKEKIKDNKDFLQKKKKKR